MFFTNQTKSKKKFFLTPKASLRTQSKFKIIKPKNVIHLFFLSFVKNIKKVILKEN